MNLFPCKEKPPGHNANGRTQVQYRRTNKKTPTQLLVGSEGGGEVSVCANDVRTHMWAEE